MRTLWIEMGVPSGRKLRRMNARSLQKLSTQFSSWVKLEMTRHQIPCAPDDRKRRLVIVRSYDAHRYRLSFDDLVDGCAPLIRAFTRSGLIKGDDDRWAAFEFDQEMVTDGSSWVRVEVYEEPLRQEEMACE